MEQKRKHLSYDEVNNKYVYQYTYTYSDTKEKQKFHGVCYNPDGSFCKKITEAQTFLDNHKKEASVGKFRKNKKDIITLMDLVNTYYEDVVKHVQAKPLCMKKNLERFAEIVYELHSNSNYPAIKVDKADIVRFRNKRKGMLIQIRTKDGYKDTEKYPACSSINRECVAVQGMFTYAIETLKLKFEEHPFKKLTPLQESNVSQVTIPQIKKETIYEICLNSKYHLHLFPIIFLIDSTGIRRGEGLGLKWFNVHFETTIFPFGHIELLNTKNGKSRTLPMSADLNYLLRILKQNSSSEYVFTNPKTNTRYGQVNHGVKFLLKSIGVYFKGKGLHVLRHGFATELDEQGTGLAVIQELLGHSTINQTKHYIQVDKRRKFEAVNLKGNCDISQYENVVPIKKKKPQDYKRLIKKYQEIIKNAHQMPIEEKTGQKMALKKRA